MADMFTVIKVFGTVCLGFLSYIFGGWDALIRALLVLTVLDIITGVCVAAIYGDVSSKTAWTGFIRKIGTYVVVALAVQLDIILETEMLRQMVVGFFITVEGISILENWGRCGLPLPEKLKNMIKQLHI